MKQNVLRDMFEGEFFFYLVNSDSVCECDIAVVAHNDKKPDVDVYTADCVYENWLYETKT